MKKHLTLLAITLSLSAIFASCSDSKKDHDAYTVEGTWATTHRVFQTNYEKLDKEFNKYLTLDAELSKSTREFNDGTLVTKKETETGMGDIKFESSYEVKGDSLSIKRKFALPGMTEEYKVRFTVTKNVLTTWRSVTAKDIKEILNESTNVGEILTIPEDMKGEYRTMEKR